VSGRVKTPTQLGPLERASLNHWIEEPNWVGVFPLTLGRKQTQFPKRRCFLVSRIPDDGKSPKIQ
jgi:hypothetical protein